MAKNSGSDKDRRLVAAVRQGDADLVASLVSRVRSLHAKMDGVNIFQLAKSLKYVSILAILKKEVRRRRGSTQKVVAAVKAGRADPTEALLAAVRAGSRTLVEALVGYVDLQALEVASTIGEQRDEGFFGIRRTLRTEKQRRIEMTKPVEEKTDKFREIKVLDKDISSNVNKEETNKQEAQGGDKFDLVVAALEKEVGEKLVRLDEIKKDIAGMEEIKVSIEKTKVELSSDCEKLMKEKAKLEKKNVANKASIAENRARRVEVEGREAAVEGKVVVLAREEERLVGECRERREVVARMREVVKSVAM